MSEDNETEKEFLKKLKTCIRFSDGACVDECVDECVENVAQLANGANGRGIGIERLLDLVETLVETEFGKKAHLSQIEAERLLDLSTQKINSGKYGCAYVLALVAARGLEEHKYKKSMACYNAGLAVHFIGKVIKAENCYKKAIQIEQSNAYAHQYYALLLRQMRRKDECEEEQAEKYYDKVINSCKKYRKSIKIDQKDKCRAYSIAYSNYALFRSRGFFPSSFEQTEDKSKDAEKCYNKAIELDQENVWAHVGFAILLKKQNKMDEAEDNFKKATEIAPKNAAAQYYYADFLRGEERFYEALKKAKDTLRIAQNDPFSKGICPYVYTTMGDIHKDEHSFEEAEKCYEKAIKTAHQVLDFELPLTYNNYGLLFLDLSKKNYNASHIFLSEAENKFRKAIEIDPKFVEAHNNLANLLRQKKQLSDAENEARIALQTEPKNPYILGTLGDILADEEPDFADFEEAIKEYQKALKNSTYMKNLGISELHNNLGWVYEKLKQYNKAKEEFEKATNINPLNTKAFHNLRKINKVEMTTEWKITWIQKSLAVIILIFIAISYLYLYIGKLNEDHFVTQTIFLITLIIFILFHQNFAKFKIKTELINFEFEKSTEHRLLEAKKMMMFEH